MTTPLSATSPLETKRMNMVPDVAGGTAGGHFDMNSGISGGIPDVGAGMSGGIQDAIVPDAFVSDAFAGAPRPLKTPRSVPKSELPS
jgi:hypothetical protein